MIAYIIALFLILEIVKHMHLVYDRSKQYTNPFMAPASIRRAPVYIRTRGEPEEYTQIGTLHEVSPKDSENPTILPLYGSRTYRGSSKWLYYTFTDQYNKVKLPVYNTAQRNCQNEYGCNELYDNDQVTIHAYTTNFKVRLYEKTAFRYIPY